MTKKCPIHGTEMDTHYMSSGVEYWCWKGNQSWSPRTIKEYKASKGDPSSGWRDLERDLR